MRSIQQVTIDQPNFESSRCVAEIKRADRADELKTGIDIGRKAHFGSSSIRHRSAENVDSETPVTTTSLVFIDIGGEETALGGKPIRLLEDVRPIRLLNLFEVKAMDQSPRRRRRVELRFSRHD